MTGVPVIGLLAVQGGVAEHERHLERLGAAVRRVRRPGELDGIDGIVLPGGESSAMRRLLTTVGLWEPLRERVRSGLPAFGTCAGMILLSGGDDADPGLGGVDIRVQRNAFGSQAASFESELDVDGVEGGPMRGVFIRAPLVRSCGVGVQVLARVGDRPVAARQGAVLVTAFHPELTGDLRMHRLFLAGVSGSV
ncbi:pyridoxal phosphate synthase yaaE subunit [Nakamurella panacisegetis]|uniref:Pyridoxal 5'-phosphate synthase subunit PdxT n=1 Tax=Nakamurella panacisegetis TaxID=1090615 RepID=A0A1H0I5X3_9ACTN|nr:pyridoxal 5'-phosphate synthase glutaminase subunit PdxT [Nakamurella panacisegetis]SDO26600.1 pyridoxal phosphate synthase yaaE subunit [Nakamurella panacisegetis]